MKKIILLLLICVSIPSFSQDNEIKIKDVVNKFLIQINNKSKAWNDSLITENYSKLFKEKKYYTSEKWELTVTKKNDSTYRVQSKASTFNSYGTPIEIIQRFGLTNVFGGWKIFNTYNVLSDDKIDFDLADSDWRFYWDRQKFDILEELKKGLILEIIQSAKSTYSGKSKEGQLKLINNTKYDIKSITVLIEHYDENGVSVNTTSKGIYDIRKNGYREFEWYATDCQKCARQEYKISLYKGSN